MEAMQGKKILVADDEKDILELLEYALRKEGYAVEVALNGEQALEKAAEFQPQVVILDIMMPGIDGIEVCRRLRAQSQFENATILILTARGEEYSEIAGFDAGADDYVTKPVKIRSLIRRLEVLQTRTVPPPSNAMTLGDLTIDREKYLVTVAGREVRLPRKEFELLYLLATQVNRVVTRDRIFETVWGRDVVVVDRTIDVHIRRLREKIGSDRIRTVKGVGYKLVTED